MKSTSPRNTPAYSSLIGIPYGEMDCWGVVREFYRMEKGILLESYYDAVPATKFDARDLVRSHIGEFDKVEKPEEYGDILLIRMLGVESHIAVYLGKGKILHTSIATGCIVDKLSKWERMVTGVFRVSK